MALLLCYQVLAILRRYIWRSLLRYPLRYCRHIWVLPWRQLLRLGGWRTALKNTRALFHLLIRYIQRYGGRVEYVDHSTPQPPNPLEPKPVSLSYMPPTAPALLASNYAPSDIVVKIIPASPDDEVESMAIGSSSDRSQCGRTSDITLNDLSRQLFSLKDPSSKNASGVSVVIPAASSLQPSNNISQTELSGGFDSSMEVSSLIYPIMPSDIPRYKRNRTM